MGTTNFDSVAAAFVGNVTGNVTGNVAGNVTGNVTGKLTAFALDGEAEKAVRLKQPEIEITIVNPATVVKLSGVANSLTGETVSDTSEFAGQSDALKGAASFDGVIRAVTIKGQSFKGVTFNFPKGNDK